MFEHNADARHPASPIRLMQARQDGDSARSQELAAAIQLLCGITAVYFLANGLVAGMVDLTANTWKSPTTSVAMPATDFFATLTDSFSGLAQSLLSAMAIMFIGAVLSNVIQTGSSSAFTRPLFDLRHLNPANSFARLFSLRNLTRGVMGIPKVAVVVLVTLAVTWHQRNVIAGLQQSAVETIGPTIVNTLFAILFSATLTLLAISLVDYFIERFSFYQRNQMTDQQLRDESRMQCPDPVLLTRREQFYHKWSPDKE